MKEKDVELAEDEEGGGEGGYRAVESSLSCGQLKSLQRQPDAMFNCDVGEKHMLTSDKDEGVRLTGELCTRRKDGRESERKRRKRRRESSDTASGLEFERDSETSGLSDVCKGKKRKRRDKDVVMVDERMSGNKRKIATLDRSSGERSKQQLQDSTHNGHDSFGTSQPCVERVSVQSSAEHSSLKAKHKHKHKHKLPRK